MAWVVGIDTGGTFTDLVALDRESRDVYTAKVPSVPSNPAQAIVNALDQLKRERDVSLSNVSFFAHGTTVATNAVLEGAGSKAGLLITEGQRAIYDMRSGSRPTGPELIDPFYQKPSSLIPQSLTYEVPERLSFDGTEIKPLDEERVEEATLALKEQGVESVAVCYLFSFMNSAHEERTAEIVRRVFPECRISLSSAVLPTIREYPRLSTTVLDAFVGPVITKYFDHLQTQLRKRGLKTNQFYIMQSNGGLMRINNAVNYPNETLLSGPAAGVVFGTYLGHISQAENVLTFDMGGTSTDISVIESLGHSETRSGRIAGQDIGTPMIEIATLGAGGGTVAHIGEDGLLKVGPRSAGAVPGPACYGLGGEEPTVTDANILLGYVDVESFIGGRMKGDRSLAEQALGRVGRHLGLDALQTAVGINKIANVMMAVGLRTTLTEKGADPRKFALAAFGGNGPVHAARLAKEVGIKKVVVPIYPGISCAVGLLQTDVKHIYMQSFLRPLLSASLDHLNRIFGSLVKQATLEAEFEGFARDEVALVRQLDLRYPHQGYELSVDLPDRELEAEDLRRARSDFDRVHEKVYGISAPDEEPEIVNARVLMMGTIPKLELDRAKESNRSASLALKGYRDVYFEEANGFVATAVYDRPLLPSAARIEGPAILEQLDCTTVIQPDQLATIDLYGNVLIEL